MSEKKSSFRSILLLGLVVVGAIILFMSASSLIETNITGHVQIKQAIGSGTMTVRTSAGTYWQGGGDIVDYLYAGDIFLSDDPLDGGKNTSTTGVHVQFPDGEATVDFVGKYLVSATTAQWLEIRRTYPNDEALQAMVRHQIKEVITNTASLMNAEDAYSSKRADFIRLTREQVAKGLYVPTFTTRYDTIGGQVQETRIYSVRQIDGHAVISKEALLSKFNIKFEQFNIKDIHSFDDRTKKLIDKRKEAKTMQQEALTEKAKGEKQIAIAKATQEASKITEVTIAEKEAAVAAITAKKKFEIAKYAALEAKQNALKIRAEGDANAAANRALVAAGLTIRPFYV